MNFYVSYKCQNCGVDNIDKKVEKDLVFDLRAGIFGIVLDNNAKIKDFCENCGAEQLFELKFTKQEG